MRQYYFPKSISFHINSSLNSLFVFISTLHSHVWNSSPLLCFFSETIYTFRKQEFCFMVSAHNANRNQRCRFSSRKLWELSQKERIFGNGCALLEFKVEIDMLEEGGAIFPVQTFFDTRDVMKYFTLMSCEWGNFFPRNKSREFLKTSPFFFIFLSSHFFILGTQGDLGVPSHLFLTFCLSQFMGTSLWYQFMVPKILHYLWGQFAYYQQICPVPSVPGS